MKFRFRLHYLALTVALFLTEVSIALYVHDTLVRPFLGDALVIVLIYCFVRTFLEGDARRIGFGVFLFGCLIEILQYIDYVALLHLEKNRLMSVLLGRTFSWSDFLAYFAGFLMIVVAERLSLGKSGRRGSCQLGQARL